MTKIHCFGEKNSWTALTKKQTNKQTNKQKQAKNQTNKQHIFFELKNAEIA